MAESDMHHGVMTVPSRFTVDETVATASGS